jgi:lipid A 4'-phosphatase
MYTSRNGFSDPKEPVKRFAIRGHPDCRTLKFATYRMPSFCAVFPRPGGRSVARTSFIVLASLGILTGIIFTIDPSLDLQVASFFRDLVARPEVRRFDRIVETTRQIGPLLIVAAIVPAVVSLAMKVFWPPRPTPMSSRAALFLILSLALGPGLLVNGVLKENWARPRPGMVTQFGGDYTFMPWWDPRGTCDSNCSFVSGETSSAVWMTAPAMLAPPPWRYVALGTAGVYGIAFASMRMLTGGHFLSDVIFAAIFTGLVIWAVHGFLFRWPATRVEEAALNAMLEKLGRSVTRIFLPLAQSRSARRDEPTPPV